MYLYQYKGEQKKLIDMITESTLFKALSSPKILFGTLLFSMTQIPELIEKYIFGDLGFAKWLVLVLILDLVTGVTKVWVNEGYKKVTSKGLRDTVSKCIQYGALLIVTHILTHFEIKEKVILGHLEWLNKLTFEFLIFIECKSVYENIVKINPRLDIISVMVDKGKEILDILKVKNN